MVIFLADQLTEKLLSPGKRRHMSAVPRDASM
jgi:hypothetical protein